MKIMIASDIHGSAFYCGKLLERYSQERPEKLLILGDILYHGPRNALPKEYNPQLVAEMLNKISERLLCVRGNCDSEVDQMVLNFPIMAEYAVLFYKNRMIYMTHGHIFNKENMPGLSSSDILLTGHTHVPACESVKNCIYINPGSISIPKEESTNSYMILDDEGFKWFNIDGSCYKKWNV